MLIDEKGGKDPSARKRRGREKKKEEDLHQHTVLQFTLQFFFSLTQLTDHVFLSPSPYDHDDERDEVIRLSRVNSDLD